MLGKNSGSVELTSELNAEERVSPDVKGNLVVLLHERYESVHVLRFVAENIGVVNKKADVGRFGLVDAVEEAWVELGLHVAFFLEAVSVVLVP